jgi:tetratricopeptide (TPR) repeat protein
VSRTREGDPKKLRSRLRGDLDAIVMTALRKEPQRRYASVYDFSEDIRRHLERLPVKARPSTVRYRGAKFISRHKEMMATVLIFILLLGAGVSWYAIRGGRIGSYRLAPAKGRRSIAVLGFKNLSGKPDEAWLSTALSEMLTTELAAGEKLRTIPGENVARMKIDLAMPDSDSLAPDTLQKIYRNLGSNLVVLGSYLSMGGQLRLDLRLQDATNGEILAAISETGRESEVSDLVSRTGASLRVKLGIGEVSGAEVLALKATRPDGPEVARLYSEGLVKLRTFDNLGARDLLQKAVALEPRFPLTHAALARAWSGLGFDENAKQEARKALDLSVSLSREEQLGVEGQYRETVKDWGKAVETYRALFTAFPDNLDYGLRLARAQTSAGKGQDALVTVRTLRKLAPPASDDPRIDLEEAVAAQSLGDFTRDQAMAAKAAEKGAAQGARLLVARARGAECRAEHSLGHPKQAQTACEAAQRIFTEAGDLAGRANVLNVSALALTDQGDFAGARAKLDEALSAFREIGNKGGVAMSLGNIARILSNQGNNDGAQKMYVQALAIYREIGDRRGAAVLLHNIGNRLFSKGDLAGARKNLEESLAINREIGRKDLAALTLVVLAQTLERQGDLSGARKRLEDAKSMLRASGDKRYSAIALSVSGELLITEGDLSGARKELEQALRIQNELGNKGQATEVTVSLAELSMEEGHAAETAAPLREAVAEFQKEKAADNEISAQSVLARALLAMGNPTEAKQEIARVAELVGKSQNRGARLQMAMVAARVGAALGNPAEAEKKLQAALAEASKYGLVGYQFEARLALGEVEMKSGNSSRGRSRLQALEKEASAKGFVLIAKKAAAARSERPTAASH